MGSYSFYQEPPRSDELYHHGIKGQKWGVRRFQQANGTLTSAGKRRYLESLVPTSTKRPANAMGGPGPLMRPSNARADRSRQEAQTAHKLATAYKNRMSAKAAKRQAQADASGKRSDKARADRAKQEAKTANKLADKYTSKMDAKAAKRQAQADAKANTSNVLKQKWDSLSPKQKTAIKAGAAVAVTGLALYGGHKLGNALEANRLKADKAKFDEIFDKTAKQMLLRDSARNVNASSNINAFNTSLTSNLNKAGGFKSKQFKAELKNRNKDFLKNIENRKKAKHLAEQADYIRKNLPNNTTNVKSTVRHPTYFSANTPGRYRYHNPQQATDYYKQIVKNRKKNSIWGRAHGGWAGQRGDSNWGRRW